MSDLPEELQNAGAVRHERDTAMSVIIKLLPAPVSEREPWKGMRAEHRSEVWDYFLTERDWTDDERALLTKVRDLLGVAPPSPPPASPPE